MPPESNMLPPIANPTIEQVFAEFLTEQGKRLKPKTLSKYRSIVSLLRHHLNSYGYEGLPDKEAALFDRLYNAKGSEHKEFCELFGPDKIVGNLSFFLNYFMVRKVMAGAETKRAAGTVTKQFCKWLAEKGHIKSAEAAEGSEAGADAARSLPAAERAAEILADAEDTSFAPDDLPDKDYMEFDHYTIAKIEPGKLWLEGMLSDESTIGPISVPRKATELLQEGWDISCALARIRGKWRLVEVANVYPH